MQHHSIFRNLPPLFIYLFCLSTYLLNLFQKLTLSGNIFSFLRILVSGFPQLILDLMVLNKEDIPIYSRRTLSSLGHLKMPLRPCPSGETSSSTHSHLPLQPLLSPMCHHLLLLGHLQGHHL